MPDETVWESDIDWLFDVVVDSEKRDWLVDTERDWDRLVETETEELSEADTISERLKDSDTEAWIEAESIELSEVDSTVEPHACSEVEAVAEDKATSEFDGIVKTWLSWVATTSSFSMTFSTTGCSSADTESVTAVPPQTAPAAANPFNSFTFELSTFRSWRSSTLTDSCLPKIFKKPKLEVAARNQCFPDLTSLKRVTRSVSRNFPVFFLKNMPYRPLYNFIFSILPYFHCYSKYFFTSFHIFYFCYFLISQTYYSALKFDASSYLGGSIYYANTNLYVIFYDFNCIKSLFLECLIFS